MVPDLHVVIRVHGALEEVLDTRERPSLLIQNGVLGGDLPYSDLAVLVAGEDPVAGDDNGFHKAATGLETRIFLLVLPDPNVLAVGPGVEEVAGGGEGVDVAFFADEGADEASVGVGVVGPGGGGGA
eukprot:TRINITY_DN71839_c0_g1_i1.p2 TRINITY_DN71839_c0_g1~~TRINITY_DN71839_c0_g1_i1.p2  ORF type:complete len:127 (-),score=24.87 TRINITY_DN71839_c0_g1_i1:14-394(-)